MTTTYNIITQPQDYLFYDAACGFCNRWILFWRNTLARRGIAIAPLQSEFARERFQLSEALMLQDLRLISQSDEHIQGADVYRYVMRRIWWAFPLLVFANAPGFRQLFDRGYWFFATHRYRISRTCGLDNR